MQDRARRPATAPLASLHLWLSLKGSTAVRLIRMAGGSVAPAPGAIRKRRCSTRRATRRLAHDIRPPDGRASTAAFTAFSHEDHRPVTRLRRAAATVGSDMRTDTGGQTLKLQRFGAVALAAGALAAGPAACGGEEGATAGPSAGSSAKESLSGSIRIDGSSTVEPVAQAAIELFAEQAPDVDISVGGVGTGDGFEKFCRGELQIADASRPIEKDELEACGQRNITPVEVQVGIDGLSVIANKDLAIPDDCITTAQLKKLLDPKSKVANFKELGAGFPDQKVSFFTPGTESGTYDFFTEVILETDAEQRTKDVQTSADDNQIVTGIEGTPGGLGYVGFSFAGAQADKLKILAVDGGDGCVKPELSTIADGTYKPLSRPLFMYPSTETVKRPEVRAYLQFVLDNNEQVVTAADYVPLTDDLLSEAKSNLDGAKPVEAPAE
jgi:phosphate transport system substrate-binding protein